MMIRKAFPFAPMALLLAGASVGMGAFVPLPVLAAVPGGDEAGDETALAGLAGAVGPVPVLPTARQVRIEQHFTIRITPGAPVMPPEMLEEIEQGPPPERALPRHTDQCVAIAEIGAVHGGEGHVAEGNRLLLFMRDQHIVVAALEKACRAEDFYSGFYVARNGDGLLCTNRDTLQSRSGANCKVKGFHELGHELPTKPWRRFP